MDAVSYLVGAVIALVLLPALMTLANLALFRRPGTAEPDLPVSLVIPARTEAAAIGACLAALRRSTTRTLEIIVADDGSTDGTAAIVQAEAAADPRIRLLRTPDLPPGWSGKMHALQFGADQATHATLVFIDTDVRLTPDALPRLAGHRRRTAVALLSGFPRELALTTGERLLVPLIHVFLLGYLPFAGMRLSTAPGFGAGCGQLMVADAAAYRRMGGHGAIRATWHDGIALPRAFRQAGMRTDIADASTIATCRMYRGFRETWRGFSKNATEGMATPAGLPVWTMLLGGGFVLPVPLLLLLLALGRPEAIGLGGAIIALAAARILVAWRCGQDLRSVLLTVPGIAALLALLWRALSRSRQGAKQVWRGRVQISS